MPGKPKRYFRPREVEMLIPQLTKTMGQLMELHGQLLQVRAALREDQQRITMAGGGIVDRGVWRQRTRLTAELARDIQQGMKVILDLGGVPKDLGLGLVDFPYLMDDREVNLCWRFGETGVGFWHDLDEGYAGRKPL